MPAVRKGTNNTATGFFGNCCLLVIALYHSPLKYKRILGGNLTNFTNDTTHENTEKSG